MARIDRPARIRVGTSGFSHARWRGTFYPPDLPPGDMLRHYATRLECVEIGITADRPVTERQLTSWRRETPPGFVFFLKGPKRVTHDGRLVDDRGTLDTFVRDCTALGSKLGGVLLQLPPHLHADPRRLDRFLAGAPRQVTMVVDCRHPSWFTDETYAVLRRHRAPLCVTDTDDGTTPLVPTAPLGYVRLRRTTYSDEMLADWVARIRAVPEWRRAYLFVKHDETGRAGLTAMQLRSLSETASS